MKSEVIVLDRGIFLRERSSRRKIPVVVAPEEKYRGPKQSPTNSHNDRKIDDAKLLLSLIITILDIFRILGVSYEEILYLTYFCTHCLSIPVREFRSVQA